MPTLIFLITVIYKQFVNQTNLVHYICWNVKICFNICERKKDSCLNVDESWFLFLVDNFPMFNQCTLDVSKKWMCNAKFAQKLYVCRFGSGEGYQILLLNQRRLMISGSNDFLKLVSRKSMICEINLVNQLQINLLRLTPD